MPTKFIFVTGGVVSSLGKGITAASLGRLLKCRGLKVAMQKFDPYININPALMSPLQHGEVFVTGDGGECDLDVGHYERFIDENLTVDSDITSGQVYLSVLNKERAGGFNGGTVQVVPHITNEIKRAVFRVARSSTADVVITEIGGTVGDIEGLPFLEAARQVKWEVGAENCLFIHVTLVPYIGAAGELKTKPTQHSVKELRSIGIQPDIIVTRCEKHISDNIKAKIGSFCNVDSDAVIPNYDAKTLYEVPLMLKKEGLDAIVCKKMNISANECDMSAWTEMVEHSKKLSKNVNIALVGKYVDLHDAYLSVDEALNHAGVAKDCRVNIKWVYSAEITCDAKAAELLGGMDAIIMPYGFGERGMEGMILTAKYARENKIPFFAMGMGMHMAIVEFAKNVCKLDADSAELTPETPNPVISLMAEYKYSASQNNETMRLGAYKCTIAPGSKLHEIYGMSQVQERHRHRYELNPEYESVLEASGMKICGRCEELSLAEAVEIPDHPWYICVQFNAEFTSRPNRPHPLFLSFIDAALKA